MGFVFVLVGGMLFVNGIVLLLNPDATMSCNGVVTNDPGCKRQFVTFSAVFVLVGLAFLFSPRRWLNQLVVWQESLPSLFRRKR